MAVSLGSRSLATLVLVTLTGLGTGCASDSLVTPQGPKPVVLQGDAGSGGTLNPMPNASGGSTGGEVRADGGQAGAPTDASVAAVNDAAQDGAMVSSDAGTFPPPTPVDPCDPDPLASAGTVRPDVGELPSAAGFAGDVARLDEMGAFKVLVRDVSIPSAVAGRGTLTATYYVPSTDGQAPAEGPFPLVLVMHGFGTNHLAYAHFSQHFASHGFLALGLTFPFSAVAEHDINAREAIGAIDHSMAAAGPVAGLVDASKVAVAGHSMGGKIGFFAATLDPRIDVVIGWDPSNAGGPPCFISPDCHALPVAPNCAIMDAGLLHQLKAESLVFRAAPDGANPEPVHNAINFFRGAPAPATLLDYDDAALHGDWATATATVIPHTKAIQIALLLSRFRGITGLQDWLPGGSALASGAGVQQVLRK